MHVNQNNVMAAVFEHPAYFSGCRAIVKEMLHHADTRNEIKVLVTER